MTSNLQERQSLPKRLDKDAVHQILIDEIVEGELVPGTPLSERALVDRFGISRTPIREIIWMLERDGLVEVHGNKGAFVKKLGATEVLELFQLREALEPLAAMLAARSRPKPAAEAMMAKFDAATAGQPLEPSDLVKLGGQLHDAIALWSGNRMLLRIYETLRRQTQLLRSLLHQSAPSEHESLLEHAEVMRAIVDQDSAAAYSLMAQHLKRARQAIIDDLFSTPEPTLLLQGSATETAR